MSGEAGQIALDVDQLSAAESESSSRTISRRPTQSGALLAPGAADRPRPPWKTTSSTPKLLEATRKVLKASRTAKISRPASTQTEPLPCARVKDSDTQTLQVDPFTTRLTFSTLPNPGSRKFQPHYCGSHHHHHRDIAKPPKAISDLLSEISGLLKTFDKISTSFYGPMRFEDNIYAPRSPVKSQNLEEDLLRSCRELEESVRRSEISTADVAE